MASQAPLISIPDILQRMADALPKHEKGDDSSDVASSYEVFALLVHAYLTSLNFILRGFGEGRPFPESAPLAPRLPAEWNNGFGSFTFDYKHNLSSLQFVIKVDRMGAKVEIRGLATPHDKIQRFERTVKNVILSGNLPIRIKMTEEGDEDRSDLPEQLRKVFVSEGVIQSFISDLDKKIVQTLMPGLTKDTKDPRQPRTAEAEAIAVAERHAQEAQNPIPAPSRANPSNLNNDGGHRPDAAPSLPSSALPQMAQPPRPPVADFPPPGFEDEHQMNQDMNRALREANSFISPGRSPYNIGHDDLNPPGLGPHDPLRPHFIPGAVAPPGGFSGMHPTFNDPLFTGQGGWGGVPNPGGMNPGGINPSGYYPAQAPPGARWDPVGPGGTPRFPGQGWGQGQGQGNGNGNGNNNNPYGGYGGYGSYGGGYGGGGGGII